MLVALQALNSVLPVEDSFSNKEMRIFSGIGAHQSTSGTFNRSLWRRKTKPASVNIVVLVTNKTCGTFPWDVFVFSVLWNIMFHKFLFITLSKRTCFIFQLIFPHFFLYTGWPEGPETDIVASSDSVSHLIYPGPDISIGQGYSIILRKGPVTNVKVFRGPVTPIKSWRCDMAWIFLTKNVIWEFYTIILYIDIQNPVNGYRY